MGIRAKLSSAKVWLAGKGWSIEPSHDYGHCCFDVIKLRIIRNFDDYVGAEIALLGLRVTVLKYARARA
jgi:hypothetical protein